MENINNIFKQASDLHDALIQKENVDLLLNEFNNNKVQFTLNDKKPFSNISNESGIYIIEVKFPFSDENSLKKFCENWGMAGGENLIPNCPRCYKTRLNINLEKISKQEYIPFYLGKQKNIQERLNLHLDDKIKSTTYGLKLKERSEILKDFQFKVSWVALETNEKSYFCVKLLESALRKRINPLLGKQ